MDRYFPELTLPDNNYDNNNVQPNNPQNLLNNYDLNISTPSNQFASNFDLPLNDTLSSIDFSKEIDDFTNLFQSLEDDQYLTNTTNDDINSTFEPCNSPMNNDNLINSNSSKQSPSSNSNNLSYKINDKPKNLFDELRDLIPVISFTSTTSNQNNNNLILSNAQTNTSLTSLMKDLIQERTELKRQYRQKALAKYRAKKLNRIISRNHSQNTMYVRRQAVAFRRPRNNGRFMGLQTHYISVTQFSSNSTTSNTI